MVNLNDATLFLGLSISIFTARWVSIRWLRAKKICNACRNSWLRKVWRLVANTRASSAGDYQQAVTAIDSLMQQQANEEVASGARVLGVHYEGPFVNSLQCGALHAAHFKSFSGVVDIETLPTPRSPGAVRMMTLAPEVPGAIELTRELVDRGWIVSLGHTEQTSSNLNKPSLRVLDT